MELIERAKQQKWYHTLELQPGVWTDGWFDLRPAIDHYGLPEDMTGMRALEVGTWDGFWAFEMEKRGAEVVAIDLDDERDLDWPPRHRPDGYPEAPRGAGFALAKEIRGSAVERIECSIYDALPEDLGTFDLVLCGSVLIHLRDQLLALERIAGLCRDVFVSAEPYDRLAGLVPLSVSRLYAHRKSMVFWQPSVRTWRRMLWAVGFERIEQRRKFKMRSKDFEVRHVVFHAHKEA
jgi:tRNA (mo5U34)-methyltransferase